MIDVEPFRVDVPEAVLDDLHERLAHARLPNWIDDIGWDQGIERETYLTLLDHWRDGFDWRAQEEYLNRVEHGITEIDGQPVHFVHARSSDADGVPLVLVHGWPGSFHEFLDAIPLLTDPPDGGRGFHVVAPDVPGFGFSAPTSRRGWNSRRTGQAFGELMTRLGYERFGLQGGDVGAGVTQNMADLFPDRAVGLHLNFCLIEPYEGAPTPTDDEQQEMARLALSRQTSMGYLIQQSTKPQTLGIALQDSPAGHLAWIAEKLQAWSDSDGDLFRRVHPRPGADLGHALLGVGVHDLLPAHVLGEPRRRRRERTAPSHRGAHRRRRLPGRTGAIAEGVARGALRPRPLHEATAGRALRGHRAAGALRRRRARVLPKRDLSGRRVGEARAGRLPAHQLPGVVAHDPALGVRREPAE